MTAYTSAVKAIVFVMKQSKALTDLRFGSISVKFHSFTGMLNVNVFKRAKAVHDSEIQ